MYDQIVPVHFHDEIIIDHGIKEGNNKIFLIKTGHNGSIYGYRDKYLQIAERIHEKFGVSVFCVSNPFDGKNPLDVTVTLIEEYCSRKGYKDYSIYFMGHSFGALAAAWYGHKYYQIKRMLLVNLPLQIRNYNYTVEGLQVSDAEKISIVYGEYDPSYAFIGLLDDVLSNKNIEVDVVPNEDHNFTFRMEDFLSLPEKYLF